MNTPSTQVPNLPDLETHAFLRRATGLLPGIVLTFALAGVALTMRSLPYISAAGPFLLAIMLGIAVRNIFGLPARCQPGSKFVLTTLLRLAIALLGLQLTLGQLAAVGGVGLVIVVTILVTTFLFTGMVGRWLSVDARLVQLIAAGTAVCGASAVIVTNAVTKGTEEDVTYAVAIVTVFGSLSMFLYPMVPALLELGPRAYGLWAGASIHEIAQVVAAAFQNGQESGEFAVIVKLNRVIMLAPMVLALGWVNAIMSARKQREESGHPFSAVRRVVPVPWFVLAFFCMIAVNSFDIVPPAEKKWAIHATTLFFAAALAAMGLGMDLGRVTEKGSRPLLLGAASWAFITLFSLALIKLIGM